MAPSRDASGRFVKRANPAPEPVTVASDAPVVTGQQGTVRLVKRSGDVWDAADQGRRLHGWNPRRTGPQSHWASGNQTVVARSRDAVRNNPHAARAIDVLVGSLVGPGLTPQWESLSPARNVKLTELWKRWAKPRQCDRGGRLSVGAVQSLAERTRLTSGSCFVRRWWVDGQEVPLQVEVFEPDLLDVSKFSASPRIEYGIELDEADRAVAYHFLRRHPGDNSLKAGSSGSVRVPADDIIHYYKVDRAGALNGTPALAPVLARLRQLDDYDIATITRQQIAATITAFVRPGTGEMQEDPTSTGDGAIGAAEGLIDGVATDAYGDPVETLENGLIVYLPDGKEVTISDPPTPVDGEWKKGQLRTIASGVGITTMQLTGDLTEANYSSMRAGLIEYRNKIDAEREHTLIPTLLDRIGEWFVEAAFVAGQTTERYTPCSWAARAWTSVDPVKDAQAMILMMSAGLALQPDLLTQQGYDPDQYLRDAQTWLAKLAEHGLKPPEKTVLPAEDKAAE